MTEEILLALVGGCATAALVVRSLPALAKSWLEVQQMRLRTDAMRDRVTADTTTTNAATIASLTAIVSKTTESREQLTEVVHQLRDLNLRFQQALERLEHQNELKVAQNTKLDQLIYLYDPKKRVEVGNGAD